MVLIRFTFLALLKILGFFIYPSRLNWISKPPRDWSQVSLILILNHTSLFEFVYGVALPFRFLWELSHRLVIPVAEVTLNKPISGFVFSKLSPKTIGLSRKRDGSWEFFLSEIAENDICIFMPEGQMKRKNGFDKNGNPMMVKQGVYDLLQKYQGKNMVLVYSKGLHHILAPGDKIPKIFKRIEADLDYFEVNQYLDRFDLSVNPGKTIANDLQYRRDQHCIEQKS